MRHTPQIRSDTPLTTQLPKTSFNQRVSRTPPRLVRILRDMRAYLIEKGATFRFDTKVEGFLTRGGGDRGAIRGLKLAGGGEILADR